MYYQQDAGVQQPTHEANSTVSQVHVLNVAVILRLLFVLERPNVFGWNVGILERRVPRS